MGTNYYHKVYAGKCETCGQESPPKHIGKSSFGWTFGLHVYPDEGINGPKDWLGLLNNTGIIENEYKEQISVEDFMRIMYERKGFGEITDLWLIKNSAVRGPNGLASARIDGKFCIGHDGTCDLLIGDFS